MAKFTRFLSGFILGAVICGGLALLFTPDSGEKMQLSARKYIEDSMTEIKSAASKKREELQTQLTDLRAPLPKEEA